MSNVLNQVPVVNDELHSLLKGAISKMVETGWEREDIIDELSAIVDEVLVEAGDL